MKKDQHQQCAALARLLDSFGADLANDLEWALGLFETYKERMPKSPALAERLTTAQRHLRSRRAYERACEQSK